MEEPQPNIVPPMVRIPQVPPRQVAGNRRVYIPPTFRRVTTPVYRPVQQGVPETPGLLSLQMSPIQEIQPDILIRTSHMEIPVTPPCSMPRYLASEEKRQEPGMAETLLGCGWLF